MTEFDRRIAAAGEPGPPCPRCSCRDTWSSGAPSPRGWRYCTGCGRYWDARSDPGGWYEADTNDERKAA